LARQLRKPGGIMGRKVGMMMNKANAFLYDTALHEMKLQSGEQVLEIGFGNGLFFEKILSQAPALSVSGIDYSPLMVREASTCNSSSIENGQLTLVTGTSNTIPWPNNHFDKIFCINVVYFWDEPQKHLQEIKRVLKPGGRFYAIFRTKESMKLMPFTAYGFTAYDAPEWALQIKYAGLTNAHIPVIDEPVVEFEGKPFRVQCYCAVAEKPV
jgi:ubiquinone/menaquinone biosynthesis C-methylase UbiE